MNRSLIKMHYAWIVAAVTFLALLVSAAVRSAPGILIVPLEQEFGWSRATISLAVSVNLLLYGLIGPFAAGLINRYGLRKVMLLAFTIVSVGVSSTTLMQSSSQLVFLWGVLVGCGTGMTAIVLGAAVGTAGFIRTADLSSACSPPALRPDNFSSCPFSPIWSSATGGGLRSSAWPECCSLCCR